MRSCAMSWASLRRASRAVVLKALTKNGTMAAKTIPATTSVISNSIRLKPAVGVWLAAAFECGARMTRPSISASLAP